MTREEAINHLKTVAKNAIDSGYDSAVVDAVGMATKALEQEPKTGTWRKDIDNSRRWDRVRFYCSECGSWQTYGETDFCPSCGAKMAESEG